MGSGGFVDELHVLAREVAPVLRSALFVYDAQARPQRILATSQGAARVAPLESERYVRRYFRLDPLRGVLAPAAAAATPQPRACLLDASGIDDADYRGSYHHVGLNERLSLVARDGDGGWLALNLYREAAGPFQAQEVDRLCALAPLLVPFALRHAELTRPPASGRTVAQCRQRLLDLDAGLPGRELDVCALILMGLTGDEIASDLGVANHKELHKRCF